MRRNYLILALCLSFLPAAAQNPAVTVSVDAAVDRKPINPLIYGIAYGTAATLSDLNVPLNRYGGNNTSRYNWQLNADNRGFDWYFESIPESSAVAGERGDTFITTTRSAGAQPMLTIPMIEWVAKLGANRNKLASYSQAKYGAQTGNDWQWFADAGNGILKSTGQEITWNDPNDANTPNSTTLQDGWVQHLVSKWGLAANGGLKYYILDNEYSLWHSTHRDARPTSPKMAEIRDKMLAYANVIKSRDASAVVVGPEEWGWSGYIFSGYDQQWGSKNGWSNLPDRTANGNMDYLPWLLSQLRASSVAGGQRPLDVFSVHYYPQGGEFGNDVSTTMQTRRNRSTRSLWDPTYVDETWINTTVKLIPRLRTWVDTYYYAGTPIALTEYNWGAENHINGATAQADVWGIFGREGLDIGARWTTPDPVTPTYKAMKMYRNYDGNKSTFGDTSVRADVPNPDNLAAFASIRTTDGALTVMVINKYLSGSTPVTLNLANFAGNGSAQAWQLTASNTISRLSDIPYTGTALTTTVPQQSVTLLVLPAGSSNRNPVAAMQATLGSGNSPLTVQFTSAGSADPDGSITSYAWNFGNGATASGPAVSYTYTVAGSYTARLTVTDNNNATASTTQTITVADPSVIAAPTALTGVAGRGYADLRWNDNANNETGYRVERVASGSTTWSVITTLPAGAQTYRDSAAKGSWQYRVRAFNQTTGSASAYSNTVTVRIK